ncbi:helix-turn-helix transcriptional regulator [Dyella sp. 20L07]|uniref:helix-turn-helix transcriptional regulator n=1 Tax=Dyella sp. 20L07 TaxID=3384240 RepID=UPI003D2E845F
MRKSPGRPKSHSTQTPAAPATVLRHLLDELLVGIILTDATARPCYANREAQQLLALHDGLMEGPAGLIAATARATRQLHHALAVMTLSPTDGRLACPQYLAVPRSSRHAPPLLLRLSPLPGAPTRVAIFITRPEHLQTVPREAIAAAFGLTPREAALAGLLAEGHALRECARLLVMGEGTARNHLKHVFEKTVKHSQASLVAELCRIAGPCR